MAKLYGDLVLNFSESDRNNQVDILCETDIGKLIIEFQLIDKLFLDYRALA
jgi:hypothetical protein